MQTHQDIVAAAQVVLPVHTHGFPGLSGANAAQVQLKRLLVHNYCWSQCLGEGSLFDEGQTTQRLHVAGIADNAQCAQSSRSAGQQKLAQPFIQAGRAKGGLGRSEVPEGLMGVSTWRMARSTTKQRSKQQQKIKIQNAPTHTHWANLVLEPDAV